MALDQSKLQNLKKGSSGKITARCPACQAAGSDNAGEHLVIYPDGKYGCVAYPKDKEHNKDIFKLVGVLEDMKPSGPMSIQTVHVPPSRVLMDLGEFDRFTKRATRTRESNKKEAPSEPVVAMPEPEEIVI